MEAELTLTEESSREIFKVLEEQDKIFMEALLNGERGFTLKCSDGRSVELVPQHRQEGWIPCSERLPKEGETVLVCMGLTGHKYEWEEQRIIEFGRISSDRYDAEGTGWEWLNESGADYWEPDYGNSIVAWMPLPAPYKGRSE